MSMIEQFAIRSAGTTTAGAVNFSAGTTSGNLSAVTFSNSNGVSFGLSGSVITASVVPGGGGGSVKFSAGTLSSARTDLTFSNSNGVSFGLDAAGVVTATVKTDYQSSGAYLTTAMASDRGTDFVQATAAFAGTNASGTINSTGISVSVAAQSVNSVNISAGTTSNNLTALTFSNSNNVSFGMNGSTITGSIATTYAGTGFTTATTAGTAVVGTLNTSGLSLGIPAFLTTAALSQDSSKYAGTGFTTATTAGTAIVGTQNTAGLSLGVPAFLTTAMASNAATISNIFISAGTTSTSRSDFTFSNSNNISFGLGTGASAGVLTGSIATTYAGTGLTTATTAGTAVVGTLNTSGLSLGVPAFLTTAALSQDSSKYAGTGFTTATTAGTAIVGTHNTAGLSMGVPAFLTTAMASNAATISNIFISAGTTSSSGSAFTFSNSNNVSFGLGTGASAGVITGSIATTYAGTGFTSATTAGTNIVATLNTSGLSMGVPAYITAAGASPINVSAGTTSNNIGSVVFRDSNGVSFGLGTGASSQSVTASIAGTFGISAANTSYALSSLNFLDSAGGVSWTLGIVGNSSIIIGSIASYPPSLSNSQNLYSTGTVGISEGGGAITIARSTSAGGGQSFMFSVPQTSSIVGVNGISIVVGGSTISVSQNIGISYFENMPLLDAASITLSASGSVLQVVPFVLPDAISIGYIRFPVSMSYVSTEASGTTANSTWTVNRSYTDVVAIMTQNFGASSLSLAYLTSSSATWVFQNQIGAGAQGSRYTVTQNVSYPISNTTSNYTTSYAQSSANVQISSASMTLFTGPHWLDIPFAASLSAGNYWLVLGRSTNSATQAGNAALGAASMGMSYIGASQNNLSLALMGAATNSSNQLQQGLGSWSTNAAVQSTSSMALASISAMSSGPKAYFQMIRYA